MNKELEALDRLYNNVTCNDYFFRGDASEDYDLIAKSFKALEIIRKDKNLRLAVLLNCKYGEECDLLKEVL